MADLSKLTSLGRAASVAAAKKMRQGLDKSGQVLAIAAGSVAASLSELNNFALDPQLVSRITSAASNHGVAITDLVAKLPGELENYGTSAVDAFLKGGDARGKEWSHIQSQANAPHLASNPANAIWEDGTINNTRNSVDMSWHERAHASVDNHIDGLLAAAQTPEFWQRTLGNAVEASVYSAAIAAVDQLLTHRDELINGSPQVRKDRLIQILQTSGLMAAGALPVSVFLAIALMLVPGLTFVMGPLGILGTAGLGIRLLSSAIRHPSRQERELTQQLRNVLQEKLYSIQRDCTGNVTITVRAQAAG